MPKYMQLDEISISVEREFFWKGFQKSNRTFKFGEHNMFSS